MAPGPVWTGAENFAPTPYITTEPNSELLQYGLKFNNLHPQINCNICFRVVLSFKNPLYNIDFTTNILYSLLVFFTRTACDRESKFCNFIVFIVAI
jgi:hypothetical protein